MLVPRAAHVCIALQDGSILVAGGVSGPGGPTNSAEIYDPKTDNWSPTGAMSTARSNAAAILLKDGRVLISGGESSSGIASTLEIYDPVESRFRGARGVLSSPRASHAIALLNDGRILIAGGTDGALVLNSIDVFDPANEEIRPAGLMTSPRSDFTATTLADGRVLFTGGFDGKAALASSELYDPAITVSSPGPPLSAPRRHHIAVRPAGIDNVLVFGSASERASSRNHARRTAEAELFVPALNQFVSARQMSAADATGKTTANTEAHVTAAALDSEANPRDVRFYLLTPDSSAENTEAQ